MALDVNAIAQSFSLTGVANGDVVFGGEPLALSLVSDLPIGDSVITEVVSGAVDLDLLFRHVKLPDVGSTVPNGPWPYEAVASQVTQPGSPTTPDINVIVTEGLSSAPGAAEVEAWATKISGTIPLGFREIQDPVRIDYRWSFTRDGEELGSEDLAVVSGDRAAAVLSVAFRPEVQAWTDATAAGGIDTVEPTGTVGIQAEVRVRLAVSGADSGWVKVPAEPISLDLRPIPLPEVAVLFRDKHFGGDAALVMVPGASPFGSAAEVFSKVNDVSAVVSRVGQVASLTAWAVGAGGLVSTVTALAAAAAVKHLGFKKNDEHDDLGKYNFIPVDWWIDTDIEDRASSALGITLAKKVSFYQHDDQDGKRLTLDARPNVAQHLGGVVVADLHAALPAALPPSALTTSGSPGSGWGDTISSYRWEA